VWKKRRYLWKNEMSFVLLWLSAGRKRLIMKGQEKLEQKKKKGELFLSSFSTSK
jgi:hypothetical protein